MTGASLRKGGEGRLLPEHSGSPGPAQPVVSKVLSSALCLPGGQKWPPCSVGILAAFSFHFRILLCSLPSGWWKPTFAMLERYVFLLSLLTNTVTSVKNKTHGHYRYYSTMSLSRTVGKTRQGQEAHTCAQEGTAVQTASCTARPPCSFVFLLLCPLALSLTARRFQQEILPTAARKITQSQHLTCLLKGV